LASSAIVGAIALDGIVISLRGASFLQLARSAHATTTLAQGIIVDGITTMRIATVESLDLDLGFRIRDGGRVRRPSKQRTPRSRERSTSTASRAEPAKQHRTVAPRLAKLLERERRHRQQLDAVRSRIDATLAGNTISEYKAIAHDIILALGLADTADELERLAAALKTRAATARRRCRSAGSAASRQAVVERPVEEHGDDMTHDPFLRKRRIIEETFGPPPGDDQLEGVDDDFEDDDEGDDHDHLGDPGDGPGPR
jgi:hypothetical protein